MPSPSKTDKRTPTSVTLAQFSPLSIARVVWKRKLLIIATCIILFIPAAYMIRKIPNRYKAEALIVVNSQKIPERYVAATISTDAGERLAAISHEIMSTPRMLEIIKTFDLYREERKTKVEEEVVEQMRKDITTKLERGWTGGSAGAFRIEFQGNNAEMVTKVTYRLANLYVQENLLTREVLAGDTAQFIDSQLQQAKRTLDEQEAKVAAFKEQHIGVLPQQENSLLSTVSGLRMQLQGNQDAINRAQQNIVLLNTALSAAEMSEAALVRSMQPKVTTTPAGVVITQAGKPEKTPSQELQNKLELLKLRYTANHPDIIALQAEITKLQQWEQSEAAAAAANKPAAADKAQNSNTAQKDAPQPEYLTRELLQERERLSTLRAQIALAKKEVEARELDREHLLATLANYQSRIDQLPNVEQQMAALTRDYDNSKSNYKSLFDKKLAAGMASDMERRQQAEQFTIVDPPRVPQKPFKPNRMVLYVVAAIGSLCLGVALALGIELPKNLLLGEWELPPDTVILGRVPVIRLAPLRPAGQSTALKAGALSLLPVGILAIYLCSRGG